MKNLYSLFFAATSRIFVFLATCAAEKLLISENRFNSGFGGHVGGIGGSGVKEENSFSANGIPAKNVFIYIFKNSSISFLTVLYVLSLRISWRVLG